MRISKIRQIVSVNFMKTDKIIFQVLDDRHLRQETSARYHNAIVEFLRNKTVLAPFSPQKKLFVPSIFS